MVVTASRKIKAISTKSTRDVAVHQRRRAVIPQNSDQEANNDGQYGTNSDDTCRDEMTKLLGALKEATLDCRTALESLKAAFEEETVASATRLQSLNEAVTVKIQRFEGLHRILSVELKKLESTWREMKRNYSVFFLINNIMHLKNNASINSLFLCLFALLCFLLQNKVLRRYLQKAVQRA